MIIIKKGRFWRHDGDKRRKAIRTPYELIAQVKTWKAFEALLHDPYVRRRYEFMFGSIENERVKDERFPREKNFMFELAMIEARKNGPYKPEPRKKGKRVPETGSAVAD